VESLDRCRDCWAILERDKLPDHQRWHQLLEKQLKAAANGALYPRPKGR
jgi:hypothetical protein